MESQNKLCSLSCEHVAACANKCPKTVSWGENSLIAIGSGQSIVICVNLLKDERKTFKKIIKTLNGNHGRVNCVSWIRDMDKSVGRSGSFLVSGSADGTLTVWGCKKVADEHFEFDVMCSLHDSDGGGIACIDAIMYQNVSPAKGRCYLIASCGIDTDVKIWCNQDSCVKTLVQIQTISINPSLALTLSLHTLNQQPILICGLDNSRVHLYTSHQENDEHSFKYALSLAGHEDWVRGSDFVTLLNNDVLLATSSQDGFIRLWRISLQKEIDDSDASELKVKEMSFEISPLGHEKRYIVSLDAVLSGHEGWVYSVNWSALDSENKVLYLLSASMDKSLVLWKLDTENQIWIEDARFGEVGGNTLGFYGAYFSHDNREILAHSYNGALHLWEKSDGSDAWKTGVVTSGHFGAVLDLSWEPNFGRYIVTTSTDQTTRLFSKWSLGQKDSWHEIARPQVHGYDMQSVAMIDSYQFVSGADEKVLRVFEAPDTFIKNFETLTRVVLERSSPGPEGATVPALGLSNKAVFSIESQSNQETPTTRGEQYIENQFKKCLIYQPPTEEYLLQNSLWPETHKLYWHVYEIFCVAANSSGTLVATTAKASTPEHSTIVLWDTNSWKDVGQLRGHTLTVTQIEFSPDGNFLLSVSRDRTWILHEIAGDCHSGYSTRILARSDKKTCHSRIIWSASWTHDSKFFCTGSRDKKLMFWKVASGNSTNQSTGDNILVEKVLVVNFTVAITAVAFSKSYINGSDYLLAIGKENGHIELNTFAISPQFQCSMLRAFDVNESHGTCVKRMKWRPMQQESDEHYLASCGADNMFKIFSVSCTAKQTS